MRRLWGWLKSEVSALKALAAIVVILGALPWAFRQIKTWTSSDLKIYVQKTSQTLPTSQRESVKQLENYLVQISSPVSTSYASDMKYLEDKLRRILKSEGTSYTLYALEKSKEDRQYLEKLTEILKSEDMRNTLYQLEQGQQDQMTITIVNQSSRAIDGVRIKPNITGLYDISFKETFLTDQEKSIFSDSLKTAKSSENSVITLPKIPPDSRISFSIFGDRFSSIGDPVQIIGEGISSKIVEIREIPLEGITGFLEGNYNFVVIPLIILIVFVILLIIIYWGDKYAKQQLPSALVERARAATKESRKQDAIALLRDAQRIGYNDWDSVAKEKEFESLRSLKGFKDLIAPPVSQHDVEIPSQEDGNG